MSRSQDLDETVPRSAQALRLERVDTFVMTVVSGPDAGASAVSKGGRILVGRDEGAGLRLSDRTVSQFHLEAEVEAGGVRVRDLGSSNGTLCQGLVVTDVRVRGEVELSLGDTRIRLTPGGRHESVVTTAATEFHGMFGGSAAMRAVYARLQSAAPTSSTVLVLGESGTGKELAARALHEAGSRRAGPYEVVNCGAMPATLAESELFGHVRGAFTNAHRDREGAFERADGGTLFLDEVGELPLESQPKLLRVLESGQIQRVGDDRVRKVDTRVVAATNRDLRAEVNAGRFRADLYYRLAVITVKVPPLRERLEDLPRLAAVLVDRIRQERGVVGALPPDEALLDALRAHHWPGNVRELRNYLEQWLVLKQRPEHYDQSGSAAPSTDLDAAVAPLLDGSIREAREVFERAYLVGLLTRSNWQIIETARAAGIDRATLFRMMRRYQIERAGEGR